MNYVTFCKVLRKKAVELIVVDTRDCAKVDRKGKRSSSALLELVVGVC